MPSTHTAIATTAKGEFDAIQVDTPKPGEGQVLIKAEYAAMIAFDTYQTDLGYHVKEYPLVLGFTSAGVVVEVGSGAGDLKVGDRVTAFAYQSSKAKGLQEYSVQHYTVCAKVPHSVALDEAAAIPDNYITAFHTLFNPNNLGLPRPTSFPPDSPPPLANEPILVYGGGSIAGKFSIELLRAAGYKNVLTTASPRHHEYLKSLGAKHAFDYNSPSLVQDIEKAAGGKIKLAVDAITAEGTLSKIAKVVTDDAKVAILLPIKVGDNVRADGDASSMSFELPEEKNPFAKGVKIVRVQTFFYQEDEWQKENVMPKVLPALLTSGVLQPSRVKLLDKGTFKERVATGLDLLRNNKVSGEKVIVKIP